MGPDDPLPSAPSRESRVGIRSLARAAQALHAGRDTADVLRTAVHEGITAMGAEGGTVVLRDHRNRVVPLVTVGYSTTEVRGFPDLSLDLQLPLTSAVRECTAVWVSSREEAAVHYPALLAGSSTSHSWAVVPLIVDDDAIGALGVSFRAPRRLTGDERKHLTTLADICVHAIRA